MENDQPGNHLNTKWYHYVLAFFAGIFAVNVLPHYFHGISGEQFPSPFANPPGRGLSGPELNILWATINVAVSFSIFYFAKIARRKKQIWIAVVSGGIFMSFYLANYFGKLQLH